MVRSRRVGLRFSSLQQPVGSAEHDHKLFECCAGEPHAARVVLSIVSAFMVDHRLWDAIISGSRTRC